MTTIAYKDGIIAADSLAVQYDRDAELNIKKLQKIAGSIHAGSGQQIAIDKFVAWAKSGMDLNDYPEYAEEETFTALMIPTKGEIRVYDDLTGVGYYPKKRTLHGAIGSGSAIALGAMDAGATAVEAVKIAMKRDIYTGGRIQTMKY